MKLVLTGATGYIGMAVLRMAAERGHTVAAIVRRPHEGVARLAARVETQPRIPAGFEDADALVNLAGRAHTRDAGAQGDAFDAANRAFALDLAEQACASGIGRFIQVSTIGVHGNWSAAPVDEQSPLAADTPYARAKLAAEEGLRQRYAAQPERLLIVRPPMVYGPGCPGNFGRLARLVARNWPLPFGSVRARRSFVGVANLADFLLHAARERDAHGTCVLGDGSDYTLAELISLMSPAFGRTAANFRCPLGLLRLGAGMIGRGREMASLTRPMRVDWHLARERFRWQPPVAPAAALDETLKHFAAGPPGGPGG